jgi:hypothetical protein
MCIIPTCNKKPSRGNYCHACAKRRYRDANPLRSAYTQLRHNAKRRGKVFTLTFEQFKEFAIKTEYAFRKGRTGSSYHIDRIDEHGPYSIENIQVLTNSENVRKFRSFQYRDEDGPHFKTITVKPVLAGDCPF